MNAVMPRAYHAMVAAPHYLASAVGSSILQQGGNAFDAAVAVSAALAVVYPHMTGIGGDAFFLLYSAGTGGLYGLNGSGRSALRAKPDVYAGRGLSGIPQRGVMSAITVPGMIDAWWEVWRRFGKLPWEALLEPAVQYAERGFPVSPNLGYWIARDEALLLAAKPMAALYAPGGRLLRQGERLRQRELAASLRAVQSGGRDAFYEGALMKEIVRSVENDGGLLQEDDFRSHRSDWVEPLRTSYRSWELAQLPPNSQGFSTLMMMNMLEYADMAGIPRMSPQFYHLMAEVTKAAFVHRDRYLTDPDFAEIPLKRLLSKTFAKELFRSIASEPPQPRPHLSPASGQDTAYAAVVDAEGNAVSFIQSLYFDFGSMYLAGNTGVLLQNRGSYFSLDEAHPNALAPRKRSFHTLMPGMVLQAGKPYLLHGSQGGEGQPQTQLSILTGVLDYGCSVKEAIELPRWVYGRTWGEESDRLRLENRNLGNAAEALRRWGHQVELLSPWDGAVGQAQGILIDGDGQLSGAADPRGDGSVIGW